MLVTFQNALEQFIAETLETGYEVLLEADVVGWLFHFLLVQPGISPQHIHLDTRVLEGDGFFDLVVGPVQSVEHGRPCIRPKLVVEVKLFPQNGFTEQQHRVHFQHILDDDLPKLGALRNNVPCVEMIYDGRGYLAGTYHNRNRQEYLIERRDEIAPSVHLFILHAVDGHWKIAHEVPKTNSGKR